MSLEARKRANHIRGVTIAERAVYKRLCEFHNHKNPNPFVGTKRLAYEHECSRVYMRQIIQSLEKKRFIKFKRKSTGLLLDDDEIRSFEIDLTRWFAYKDEQSERENKLVLGVFRRSVTDPQLSQGFLSAWLEPRRTRSKRARKRVFIAIESKSHHKFLLEHLDEIREELTTEVPGVGENPEIRIIDAFTKPEEGN